MGKQTHDVPVVPIPIGKIHTFVSTSQLEELSIVRPFLVAITRETSIDL